MLILGIYFNNVTLTIKLRYLKVFFWSQKIHFEILVVEITRIVKKGSCQLLAKVCARSTG